MGTVLAQYVLFECSLKTMTDSTQCYIVDDTYSVVTKIDSVGGQGADLHEVRLALHARRRS